ncbi:MAG TPA: DNA ligase [Desulfobulbaceae bacterium]|nr:DNA ligase [Desulfobulbaceae bacterium]
MSLRTLWFKHVVLFLCLWGTFCLLPPSVHALEIMLPQVYSEGMDVSGWLMSEKLDGVRGYWNGKKLLSKNGNLLHPPAAFLESFPPFALEGELWMGRGKFQQTISIVKKQQPHDGWRKLRFAIFDVPKAPGGLLQRLHKARDWFGKHPTRFVFVIPQRHVRDAKQLEAELKQVERLGGEGLIVRKPDALYTSGRSQEILKVNTYADREAVVIAHIEGTGRNRGRLGSLLVELPDKIRFRIGTGFSDEQRINPPPIGSIITFKYYGLYSSGRPRFPSFLRVRPDTGL